MGNIHLSKIAILVSVLFFQLVTAPFAEARRKRPPRAYSFIAEDGKASQAECDGEWKLPKLKRLKEFSKSSSYMGSELQKSELKIEGEMWKHFFHVKASCNAALAKTPSAIKEQAQEKTKPELPPEEEDEEKPESSDGSESPESPEEK